MSIALVLLFVTFCILSLVAGYCLGVMIEIKKSRKIIIQNFDGLLKTTNSLHGILQLLVSKEKSRH